MKQVVVLQGVSGSGKSTLAKRLANDAEGVSASRARTFCGVPIPKVAVTAIVSADDFFMDQTGYHFVPAKIGEAHAKCFREFVREMQNFTNMILVDNTNSTVVEIAPYMLAASAFGYEAKILRVPCDPRIAYERGSHGVSLSSIEAMAQRIETSELPPWWTLEIHESR